MTIADYQNSVNPYVPNTTTIPNILFDYWMHVLSPAEFKVLMCIARKTYGWGKIRDAISVSQIEKITGLSGRGIIKNIQSLMDHGLVNKIESVNALGDTEPNSYEIRTEMKKEGGGELNSPPPELSSPPPELSSYTNNSLPIKGTKDILSTNTHTHVSSESPIPTSSGVCVEEDFQPKKSKDKTKDRLAKISDRAKSLFPRFIQAIRGYKNNYVVKNELNILEYLQKMLDEGRQEEEILRVLTWGINDNEIRGDWNGWSCKLLCVNPAAYLYNKFDQIEASSRCQKARKFAPCSNDAKALQKIEESRKNAI